MTIPRHAALALAMLAGMAPVPGLGQDAAAFPGVFDAPYAGGARFEIFPAGGGARVQDETGTAEATLTREGDTVTLTARAETQANGGLGMEVVVEEIGDGNWRGFTPDGMSEITADGRILSIGISDGYLTVLSGRIDEQTLALSLSRSPTEAAEGAEADFDMVFTFDLAQSGPAPSPPAEGEGERAGPTSDCARIITQTRVIANPGGGAMSMIMVPVCVPG